MTVARLRDKKDSDAASRLTVYKAIDGERKYQDSLNGRALLVGEEILLIEEYAMRARKEWAVDFSDNPEIVAMHFIRKVAAIAVRAMEHHGALKRVHGEISESEQTT